MKIFCSIESYLPGTLGGGPVRGLSNMVAQLSEHHEFFILTRNHDYLDSNAYPNIKPNEWIKDEAGSQVYYASGQCWKRASIEAIEALKPDWIYLQGAFSPMTRVLLSACKSNKALHGYKILLAPHGNLSPATLKHHAWRKYFWLSYAKTRNLYSHVSWHSASARESEQIRKCFGAGVDIREVPMAPAPREFSERVTEPNPAPFNPNLELDSRQPAKCLRLVYFGRLSPEKNLEFAFKCLSEFATTHPDTQVVYDVIGSGSPGYVSQLEAIAHQMPANLHISFIGQLSVSALRAQLCQSADSNDASLEARGAYACMLMPSRTENFSYTILESLQAGIPVLVSDQTPWRDLMAKGVGWDLPLQAVDSWCLALEELSRQSAAEESERRQRVLNFAQQRGDEYSQKAVELFHRT